MTLFCDIGNTFFHFWDESGKCERISPDDNLKLLSKLAYASQIYYISVSKKHENILLDHFKNAKNLSNFLELENAYSGLGDDRKAACMGVGRGAIFDFGSAITIDFVDGSYLGGVILPGLRTYSDALERISDKLILDDTLELEKKILRDNLALPSSTHDGLIAPLLEILKIYIQKALEMNLEIFFTGGDAIKFLSVLESAECKLRHDPNVVYRGIKRAFLRYHGAHE